MAGFPVSLGISSGNWPTANKAFYMPFRLSTPITVAQLWWHNGTKVGTPNVDAGIYAYGADGGMRRIVSTGSTAQGTSSVVQAVNVTDFYLAPGLYAFALVMDANSSGMMNSGTDSRIGRLMSVSVQTSAFALPVTATPTIYDTSYLPQCGLTAAAVL